VSANAVVAICLLTLREVARRRLLWVLLGLSVLSVILVGWVVTQLVDYARSAGMPEARIGLGVSQVLVFVAFMFSFVLAMSAAFLAAPAIAGDVESGTALAMLARPISRADLVIGRWVGLCLVTAAYAITSGVLAIGAVAYVSGYAPPEPVVAVGCLTGEALATLTLALALGTRLPAIAAGSISVVCFGLSWFGGVLASAAGLLRAEALLPSLDVLRVAMPTDLLWRGVVHALEPPLAQLLARGVDPRGFAADPFFALLPLSLPSLLWAIAWTGGVLLAGVVAFGRREL
jgi:ABC-type transport system involved in multi-copper enzyme maturation permease subunit